MAVYLPNQGPTETKKVTLEERINNFLMKLSKVPLKERLFFVQHLSLMLKSGISLAIGLRTLSKQTDNKLFYKILNDLADKVEKGSSFSEALRPYTNIFGELFISMIEAGELSGKLENVLLELFVQMKKEHAIISKVKSALTYPLVIMFVMVGMGIFMMVVVIPKLTAVFIEMNIELPFATKVLVATSDFVSNNVVLTLVGLVVFVFTYVRLLKIDKFRFQVHRMMLNLPVIGIIIKKINLARFARTISSLLKTDIMIIKTFMITSNVLGNMLYQAALQDMAEEIKKGSQLHDVIGKYPKLFPPVVNQMVAIGEETGELDNILVELAGFYEEEINQIMESLPSIIEPLLILVLGIAVGGMAIAILMPMYSIGNSI